ncbi:MAG: terminase gpP N-terminus-related DNA-binding protein [Thermoguttaceae bacterium]
MPKRQWNSKAVATAERRRRAFQFYLAGFTQEEIAEKVGVDRSVVSRDLRSVREAVCPGESPDVQEACFIQMERMKFKGARIGVRTNAPAVGRKVQPRGGGGILERRGYDTILDGYCAKLKL